MPRLYSINTLRLIASSAVVLSHISTKADQNLVQSLTWYNFKGFGVDLFFVLSGFIICYTTYYKASLSTKKFLKNRVLRLIPLYWFFTSLALIIYLYKPSLINSSGGNTGILSSYLLLPIGDKFLVNNAWTLTYDFLFYLIFGFCLIFFSKKNIYLCTSLFIISLVLLGLILNINIFFVNVLLLEFVFGIVLFFIFKNIKINETIALFLILIGCLLIFYQNNYGAIETILGRSLNRGVPIFLIFCGFIYLDKYFHPNNFITKFVTKLGESSYSLFLSHPFSLVIFTKIFFLMNINFINFALFLYLGALFVGYLVYKFIEINLNKFVKNNFK